MTVYLIHLFFFIFKSRNLIMLRLPLSSYFSPFTRHIEAHFALWPRLVSFRAFFPNTRKAFSLEAQPRLGRGTNENTNGLIRQYFPKNKDMSEITREDIEWVEQRLNNRPRKCLGFKTPNEVFFSTYSPVALGT
jgi:hypothetical protein